MAARGNPARGIFVGSGWRNDCTAKLPINLAGLLLEYEFQPRHCIWPFPQNDLSNNGVDVRVGKLDLNGETVDQFLKHGSGLKGSLPSGYNHEKPVKPA